MSNAMAMWIKLKDKPMGKWLFAPRSVLEGTVFQYHRASL